MMAKLVGHVRDIGSLGGTASPGKEGRFHFPASTTAAVSLLGDRIRGHDQSDSCRAWQILFCQPLPHAAFYGALVPYVQRPALNHLMRFIHVRPAFRTEAIVEGARTLEVNGLIYRYVHELHLLPAGVHLGCVLYTARMASEYTAIQWTAGIRRCLKSAMADAQSELPSHIPDAASGCEWRYPAG